MGPELKRGVCRQSLLWSAILVLFVAALPERAHAQAGALDCGFGELGKVITQYDDFAQHRTAMAVYQSGVHAGKVVLVGSTNERNEGNWVVARYNVDGSLDAGFGAQGIVTIADPALSFFAGGVFIQEDDGSSS